MYNMYVQVPKYSHNPDLNSFFSLGEFCYFWHMCYHIEGTEHITSLLSLPVL